MKSFGQLLGVVGVSLLAAGATFWIKGAPMRAFLCDPAGLREGEICLQQIVDFQKILWVDARLRKDWEKNGVPGSALWSLDPSETQNMQAFEADIAMRIMDHPRVVVYCGDENCGLSRQVADKILALDLGAEVSVLRGGWRALNEAGKIK
jgi:rhodanese-related sulfurtransferase